jgi:hypothetical protein
MRRGVPEPFRFDRRWAFAVTPEDFWSTITATDRYEGWWSWLREFEADGLHEGATARCVIQAPLPYSLALEIHVDEIVPVRSVATRITGDLVGPARLDVEPRDDGCTARLSWSLELRDRWLGRLARVARPAMSWAHDRVVDVGVQQFERRALNSSGSPPSGPGRSGPASGGDGYRRR